jgi:nitrogen regulatory protein PII
MFLILFVLHEPSRLNQVLKCWSDAGVEGITILLSTGYCRIGKANILGEDTPPIFNLENILAHEENTNRTIFSVVKDEETVNRVIDATQGLIGDLNQPNTGILTVLPVSRAYGLERINK